MGGFLLFFFITIIFSFVRYKVSDSKTNVIWNAVYFVILLISFYFINLNVTKETCGTPQVGTAFMVTFIPWFFVFLIMGLLLKVFPGWLAPFSNTFGYLFAKLAGLRNVINKILAPKVEAEGNSRAATQALQQIYGDNSLLVNQLTESNFENFWNKMSSAKLFTRDANNYKDDLLKIVRLKNIVSETIWALLTGNVAISISNSYIASTSCKRSAEEMMQKHNQFESEEAEKGDTSNNNPRVYNIN